jgi:hypothetical protein
MYPPADAKHKFASSGLMDGDVAWRMGTCLYKSVLFPYIDGSEASLLCRHGSRWRQGVTFKLRPDLCDPLFLKHSGALRSHWAIKMDFVLHLFFFFQIWIYSLSACLTSGYLPINLPFFQLFQNFIFIPAYSCPGKVWETRNQITQGA